MQGQAFLGEAKGERRKVAFAIRARMAERYDTVRVVRTGRYQYHRNFMPHLPWGQYVSYTEQMPTMQVWRAMHAAGELNAVQDRYFQPKPMEELYDLAADAHMVRNLAVEAEHEATLAAMRRTLRAWQLETRDLGLLPEYEMHRRSEGTTPYAMARDGKSYPIERVLDAAELASARDAANVEALATLLRDEDAAVRWWAATGLTMLGERAAPAKAALIAALGDASPIVRVAAAEALCALDETERAMVVLIEALKHETPYVRLRAINALDRLGDRARPAFEAMRGAQMKGPYPAEYLNRMTDDVPQKHDAREAPGK